MPTCHLSRISLGLWVLMGITVAACLSLPEIVPHETENVWTKPPQFHPLFLFGTYQGENLLHVVTKSARLTLYLSFFSLLLSVLAGVFLIFLDFYPPTRPVVHRLLLLAVYFPRLFFLILLAALLGLSQPSRLATFSLGVEGFLIFLFGATGAIFLASQTAEEVSELREQLFIHFASSLGIPSWRIFGRHVLKNCTLLPITITKQLRDNIFFLSTLSFIGLVHLQPEDLGGLICKYYSSPEAFLQGWWILFFPCATLCWLILVFDTAAEYLAKKLARLPVVAKI